MTDEKAAWRRVLASAESEEIRLALVRAGRDHVLALEYHNKRYLKGARLRYDASGNQVWLDANQVRAIESRREGPRIPPRPRRHVLYRWWGSGELLYVGISSSVLARITSHKLSAEWFDRADMMTVEHFSTRAECEAAEVKAIREEKPCYNIQHAGS